MGAGGLISDGEGIRICIVFQRGGDRIEIAESELIAERFLTGKKERDRNDAAILKIDGKPSARLILPSKVHFPCRSSLNAFNSLENNTVLRHKNDPAAELNPNTTTR